MKPVALLLLAAMGGCSSESKEFPKRIAPPRVQVAAGGRHVDSRPHRPAYYVDPLIGTAPALKQGSVANGTGGSVFPGASLPFGMVQWSPDTPHAEPSGYAYRDDEITGFSFTHFSGAGCPNGGDVPVLPVLPGSAGPARFSHEHEMASPGRYDVRLDNGILVELTTTLRAGIGRFTFPAGGGDLVIGPVHTGSMSVDGDSVSGSTEGGRFCSSKPTYRVYFYGRVDAPFRATNDARGATRFSFGASRSSVVLRLALSYVSVENAKLNLTAEVASNSLENVREVASTAWNDRLAVVQVDGGTEADKKKLYTALYHSFLHPNVFSDVDGEYLGFDKKIHRIEGRPHYANFSGWDIYRSQVPLLSFLFPKEASDILESFVSDASACGYFPTWPEAAADTKVMVGDPGALIVANAFAFGAHDFDVKAALAMMVHPPTDAASACGTPNMLSNSPYTRVGFLPTGYGWGPASTTLEIATRDFAAGKFAEALGDAVDARVFFGRAGSWRNVFHDCGLLEPRNENGVWKTPLNGPSDGYNSDYVEGNAEQYSFMVPFDVPGLVKFLGGPSNVMSRLDRFFSRVNAGGHAPFFYMGNEPNFGTPFIYGLSGAPMRTTRIVSRIVDEAFGIGPDGLPGNDDLGAMSSWLVWALVGLYPAIPGVGAFAAFLPRFSEVTFSRPNSRPLRVERTGPPRATLSALRLDGVSQPAAWVSVSDLAKTSVLDFEQSEAEDAPSSFVGDPGGAFLRTEFPSLEMAANSRGIGTEGRRNSADFDGSGNSFAGGALVTQGLAPGAHFVADGASLVWPSAELDNVVTGAQTLAFSPALRGSKLVLVGAASHGPARGTFTLTSTQGDKMPLTIEMPDWEKHSCASPPKDGVRVVAALPYVTDQSGGRAPQPACVFAVSTDLSKTMDVAAIDLPGRVDRGRFHVFALGLAP